MKQINPERTTTSPMKRVLKIVFALIAFAFQLAIYYFAFFEAPKIPYIYFISYVVAFILVIQIYNSKQNPSYKLTWTIIILSFNFFGPVIYLLMYQGSRLPNRKASKLNDYISRHAHTNDVISDLHSFDPRGYKIASLLQNLTSYPVYPSQGEIFFPSGKEMLASILKDIKAAKEYIFIEFFIVKEGVVLSELMDLLFQKAASGVEVKIIYDAVGSRFLRRRTIKKIGSHPNIEIISYNPFGLNFNFVVNYRDHRKLIIIDGISSYIGGINLADEYFEVKKRFGHWRDNGIKILGPANHSLLLLFLEMWYLSNKVMLDLEKYARVFPKLASTDQFIFPFGDGPNDSVNSAYDTYLALINQAQKSILISTPYLIIDKGFLHAIATAAKSGVEVKLLLPGIPDKKTIFAISRFHYKDLLEAGVEIYEYSAGFNHAKNIIVDNKYVVVGTVNIDYRSMFLHFEVAALLINTKTVRLIDSDFRKAVSQSMLMTVEQYRKRSVFAKMFGFLATIFGPFL